MLCIDSKLTQLDTIQITVNKITTRLDKIDQRVGGLETKIKDIEESRNYDSKTLNEIREKQKELVALKSKIDSLEATHKRADADIKKEVIDLKGRSMRDNLLFFGIPENTDPNNRESDADCVEKVLELIETKMEIADAKQSIKLHRAHRIGRFNNSKTRPIVAKFVYYPDREKVRLNGNKLSRPFGVSQQYPPEVMEARKLLVPIMLDARRQGKEAYISGSRLFINGQLYRDAGTGTGNGNH
ncbi:uncharacterized protein LOC128246236 [Mya arenaria]|uniref:uncharacterized protein LOC128246236 n=1 Tax=Mya arenaria TaxID=6604 RepID=UPI0022E8DC01|nr:uncharacterized protein LOC128246236 [Mya arenaria]